MSPEQAAVGLLDLRTCRLALIHPDRQEYAASVAKIGILLAYFHIHRDDALNLDAQTRHELGLMAKASDNALAAKYSRALGLKCIQQILNDLGFYDPERGGGLWVGKHYGETGERHGDPLADHSHAATIRQILRYFLLLEQGKLLSPEASAAMREIFASPQIPHDQIKFVAALQNERVQFLRKWGSWENWLHDAAIIRGADHHYILAALTCHRNGDNYLSQLVRDVHAVLTLK